GHDLRERRVEQPWLAAERPVHGVQHGRVHDAAAKRAERAGVVVDDVELVGTLEAGERMAELALRNADPLRRRLVVDGYDLRARGRVAGGEEGDVVPGSDEPFREQRDDPFDPAVACGRDGEPPGAHDGELHSASTTSIWPSSSRTSQVRSNARTPERLSVPSQDGNPEGAAVT